MPSLERLRQRGTNRGRKGIQALAEEFRQKRLAVGLSQSQVAGAAGIARSTYTRIETATLESLSVVVAARVAAVLGLDLSVRTYPGANPLRDAAHAARLDRVLMCVREPLGYGREVGLPRTAKNPFEQRAWDAQITGSDQRTTVELEVRATDAQALERRINLKRRDDPSEHFVLLLAATHHNRRILRENPTLFAGLRRITLRALTRTLARGEHPPDCLVLV